MRVVGIRVSSLFRFSSLFSLPFFFEFVRRTRPVHSVSGHHDTLSHPRARFRARESLNHVVIEDSLVGLRAAKGAGMKCIITYTESTKDEDFYGEGADAVVADLSKVADLICLICLICVRLLWYAGSCNDVLVPSGTVDAACGNGPAPPAREFAASSASSALFLF